MLTSCAGQQTIREATLAGADGYVIKDVRGLELACSLRMVAAERARPATAGVLAERSS